MDARIEDLGPSLNPAPPARRPDTRRMSRSAALALISGRQRSAPRDRPVSPQRPRARSASSGFSFAPTAAAAWRLSRALGTRRFLAALLGALAIGALVHGAWMLITWTPLPPQQFTAALPDGPAWKRDAACTELALRRTRGPYDASMLAYAFEAASGLCVALDNDGFRERVLQARARHLQVAGVLAVLATLMALYALLRQASLSAARPRLNEITAR